MIHVPNPGAGLPFHRSPKTAIIDAVVCKNEEVEITYLDRDLCYRAMQARDARFDGRFFTCVRTTGIYCRPICPARVPKLEHCIFVQSAAAAHQMGFRSCLRCRPEVAPGLAAWNGTATTVSRAIRLIAEGGLDEADIETFATRLGVGARHLRRLFKHHVGASPVAVAQTHRILFAKQLISQTKLSFADAGLAAGFGSVRRFNDVIQQTYGRSPRELRRAKPSDISSRGSAVTLELAFSPPYDWPAIIDFLTLRATPGVELVEAGRYCRTIEIGDAHGYVDVRPAESKNHLIATIGISHIAVLGTVVARLRSMFDLDINIAAVDEHLARDRRFTKHVAERPGVRMPGAWDPFELAVRAILGQQVSVAGATTLAGRLVAAFGRRLEGNRAPGMLFPTPQALADADVKSIGMPAARAKAITELARASIADPELLAGNGTLEGSIRALCALPGIGDWTAHYIAMRALREPDAFPATDLGLLRAIRTRSLEPTPQRLLQFAERWRPWRSYAAMRLWMLSASPLKEPT